MIGAQVLVPMRVVPLAWAFSTIEKMCADGSIQVGMPHGGRTLSQVFQKHQIIVRPVTTYEQFHARLEQKRVRHDLLV